MKKTAFVVASLISVMLASCANTDDIKTDFCPDDPNKQLPGACGCGVADVDTNQNGILDCLEGTIKDQCPDDPDKVIPGICGCGKADTDTDEDGVPDCMDLCPTDAQRVEGCDSIDYTSIDLCPDNPDRINPGVCGCDASLQDDEDKDTDGVPNCLDACPENPNKVEAGICGCDRDDDASNVLDHDGDGTPNCLDECPDNPNKVKKGSGCDIEDSDFDGLDDNEDACPYNPFITIKVSEAPADLDCDTDKDSDLHIRVSADLEQLRTGIGSACTSSGFKPECLPNGNITVCSGNYLYENVCATPCTTDSNGIASCSTLGMKQPSYRTIILERDIDLGDTLETSEDEQGHCYASAWKSLPRLYKTTFESKTGAVIRYTKNGKRCALPDELFESISLSEVRGITLDVDFVGDVHGSWAANMSSSTMTDVTYSGIINSTAKNNVGGFFGSMDGYQMYNDSYIYAKLNGCHLDHASIIAKDASYVGGFSGQSSRAMITGKYMGKDAEYQTRDLHTERIFGKQYVGGVTGSSSLTSFFNLYNHVDHFICTTAYCGGFVGYVSNDDSHDTAELTTVKNTIDLYESNANYMGGFAGWIKAKSSSSGNFRYIVSEINSDLIGMESVGGFVGQVDEYLQLFDVTSHVKGNIHGTTMVGGFAGKIRDDNDFRKIDSTITGNITASGKSLGGFVGDLQTSSNNFNYIHNTIEGSLIGQSDNVGGFVGLLKNIQYFNHIQNHIRGGVIQGKRYVGGFVGEFESKGMAFSSIDQHITSEILADSAAGGFAGELYITNTTQTVQLYDSSLLAAKVTANHSAGGVVGKIRAKYNESNIANQKLILNNVLLWSEVETSAQNPAGDLIGYLDVSSTGSNAWNLLQLKNFVSYSETRDGLTVRIPRSLVYGGNASWFTMTSTHAYSYLRSSDEIIEDATVFDASNISNVLTELNTADSRWISGDLALTDELVLNSVPVLDISL